MQITSLYFEITNQCNLNCTDCYNASGLNRTRTELAPERIEFFLSQILPHHAATPFRIILSGGEPLLHSQWHRILDLVGSYCRKDVHITVVTNSTLFDAKLYDLLQHNSHFQVQFSLDGVDEITNAKNRGSGSFAKSMANITRIKYAVPPILKMVVSKQNLHQVEEYYKLAVQLGALPEFAFVNPQGNAVTVWEQIHLSDREKLQVLRLIQTLDQHFQLQSRVPAPTYLCPLLEESSSLSLLIKATGDIQPCQLLYSSPFSIGSIQSDFLTDMPENMEKLRSKLLHAQHHRSRCHSCLCRSRCQAGCPAIAYALTQDIQRADGSCGYRKLHIASLIQTQHHSERGGSHAAPHTYRKTIS